ncbi:MAG: MMPL family transporter [Oscillospiraceae bacterium]|nr:MMPL family transporter [Oscillospiraceae bacterium]
MKKIADLIVEKRILILILVLIISAAFAVMIPQVEINRDMTKYLPDDSSMKIGMDIMEREFPAEEENYTIRVMFKDLTDDQKTETRDRLFYVKFVTDVEYDADSDEYEKNGYTKFVLHTDYDYNSPQEHSIEKTLAKDFAFNDMKYMNDGDNTPGLPLPVAIFAVSLLTIILIIMSPSWIEPFLFLFTIGAAILINLGTNVFLGSISEKTLAVAAILQLILSLDYSVILMSRYRQELVRNDDPKRAMKEAWVGAFSSISSSSLTTVVGLLALIFMSFKIGFDMGVVLAKGVFISVICTFLMLPGLILIFSGAVEKTKKPSPKVPTDGLASLCFKIKLPLTLLFVALFAGAYFMQKQTDISYSMKNYDPIAEVFPQNSTVVMLYENKDEEKVDEIAELLEVRDDVDSAVNYSNTIAKKYTAAEMPDAIKELSGTMGGKGSSIEPDEKLFNMLYYKYYGGKTGKMTAEEFLNYVYDDVLSNGSFSSYMDSDIKANAEFIKKLTDTEALSRPMTAEELSGFFGMERSDCEQLFLYYFIKNSGAGTEKMTIGEFADFILEDLAKDETYSKMLDSETIAQVKTLKSFTDKDTVEKEMTASEIADALGMDEHAAKLLMVYRLAEQKDYKPGTMTIDELIRFIKQDVAADKDFSVFFDKDALSQIDKLESYTNTANITQQRSAGELARMLGMDEQIVKQLIRLDARGLDLDNKKMTLVQFTSFLDTMMQDPTFGSGFDETTRANIRSMKAIIDTAASKRALSQAELAQIMQMDENSVSQMLMGYSIQTGGDPAKITLTDFVDYIVNYILSDPGYAQRFSAQNSAENVMMMQQLCHAAVADTQLGMNEFSQMFGMDKEQVRLMFTLYFGDAEKKMSLYDLVDYLNSYVLKDPMLSSGIDRSLSGELSSLKKMMDTAVSKKKLSYTDSAAMFGMDADTMKLLYVLKEQRKAGTSEDGEKEENKISLSELAEFLSSSKDKLEGMADEDMLSKVDTLKDIMDAARAEEKLSERRLSEITGIDAGNARKLFFLYTYKKGDTSGWQLSPKRFVDFLADNVLSDEELSKNISESDSSRLTSASKIMDAVISGKPCTSDQMADLFDGMSEKMDRSMISLLYLYHDANISPDTTQRMSVEELMVYLNDNLVYDSTFSAVLTADMTSDIKESADKLKEGISQLKGENYSRMILSVSVPDEGKQTDEFYSFLDRKCSELNGSYHLIGASAMNYEMGQTFEDEYLFITLLTAAAIFVVVLITFRSLTVPLILVLLVQCGVFITVTVVGLQGYSIYFIALVIVQCILMGAMIDYGILFSNYYRESRKKYFREDSLKLAYAGSIHTILTSGVIIVVVTAILGHSFGEPTVEQICRTISIGAASALILIVFILPGILSCLDRIMGGRDKIEEIG